MSGGIVLDAAKSITLDNSYENVCRQLITLPAVSRRAMKDDQWFQEICEDVKAASEHSELSGSDLRRITKIQNLEV